jgi:hypothetical protein
MEKVKFEAGVRRLPPELVVTAPNPVPWRTLPKKQKTPTYNFTLEQINAMKRQAVDEAVRELMELTIGLPAMALRDKKGWGKKRLSWLAQAVLELYESYDQGYLTLQDIRDTLREECGFEIRMKWRKK